MSDKRNISLDTIAGIFILYMIILHCYQFTQIPSPNFYDKTFFLYVCFMAWFFFKSGMFHHENKTIKEMLQQSFLKLWKPYLAFMIIGYIIQIILLYTKGDANWIHYILSPIKESVIGGGVHGGALHLWFIVTLFLVKSVSPFFVEKYKWSWIGCAILGYIISYSSIQVPLYVSNFFPAMFFYGLGFFMRERQYHNTIFFCAVIILLLSVTYPSLVDFRRNYILKGEYLLWLIYASSAIIIYNYIGNKIPYNIWPFTVIGKESMYWFLFHWPLLQIIYLLIHYRFYEDKTIEFWITFSLLIGSLYLLRPFIYKRRIRTVFGI